jgi:ribosome-associated heat shock protein Hsp15
LDKWLWFARFCKTRSLAQRLIERGQAVLNGAVVVKPSALVHPGDQLVITLGPLKRTIVVADVAERRGPAEEARTLFDEPVPPQRLAAGEAALPLKVGPRSATKVMEAHGFPTKERR